MLVPVLEVVLGGLEDPGVGGVGTLDVRATEESHLHGHPPQSHLTLRVLFTNTGLKVFVEPGQGGLGGSPAPALVRSEVVIMGDSPVHRVPHHVHHVDLLLPLAGPVRLEEMSVEHHGPLLLPQSGEQLLLLPWCENLPEQTSQALQNFLIKNNTYFQ